MCNDDEVEIVSAIVKKVIGKELRTLANFRESNKQLLASNFELQSRLNNLQSKLLTGPCFLRKIPPEIRVKIFKYLLVNPQLGEACWIDESTKNGATFNFGLSPALLQTCQWVRDEAAPILYLSNTFVLVCLTPKLSYEGSYMPRSALTRYIKPHDDPQCLFSFEKIPNFQSIYRWRVITDGEKTGFAPPPNLFAEFCRILSLKPPNLLEVLVVFRISIRPEKHQKNQVDAIMRDMRVLRGVGELQIRAAEKEDLSLCTLQRSDFIFVDNALCTECELEAIKSRVQSHTRIERVFEMQARLLVYAQAFERNEMLKSDMNPIIRRCDTPAGNANLQYSRNPYVVRSSMHPIEEALQQANSASAKQDSVAFRKHRDNLLEYLEPQYLRMSKATQTLRAFVEKKMGDCDTFEDSCSQDLFEPSWCEEALLLVEEHARFFERDLPPKISMMIRKKPVLRPYYNDLPREKAIREMKMLHESVGDESDEWTYIFQFKEPFKRAVNDMMNQFIEVCTARKALLDSDFSHDKSCVIDIGKGVIFEPIQWSRLLEAESEGEDSNDDDTSYWRLT